MRYFYFKDKNQNFAIRGICPHNDENCLPFEYFRFCHAELVSMQLQDIIRLNNEQVPEKLIRKFALEQTDKIIEEQLKKMPPNAAITKLLSDGNLSKNEQFSLLKGMTFQTSDILWLNKESQDMGYLLNVYHVEKYPRIFNEKKTPACYHSNPDNSITKIGSTDMTEGEMRALLEQRKVVQARIYHKSENWHCFFFTFRGISGMEHGDFGSKPHWHYWSNKCGMSFEEIKECIKDCNMPSSDVHILINRND